MAKLLRTICPRDENAHTAYGRCIPYSESPLLVKGWTGEPRRGVEWGGERLVSPASFGETMKSFLELPLRAGFETVSGRAVERGGKGWRTADAVHLYSHPVGLGEADTQCLPISDFVGAMSRNR